jgi:anti-anti-sigma regulatory factor
VLPLWWQQVWSRGRRASESLTIEAAAEGAVYQLRPRGVCGASQLPQLRAALAGAAAAKRAIVLDLSGVQRIDAAAMGSLLLLHGHQRDIRQPLELVGLTPALRRQFRYHCTDYLLGRPPQRLGWPSLAEADSR